MKIILAIDNSDYSKAAIDEVAKRVLPPKSEVRIVSVFKKSTQILEMDPMGTLREYFAELEEAAAKSAKELTADAAELLHKENPELIVSINVIGGTPKKLILEEAEEFKADLIVVGSHGYGAMESFLLGSVALAVILHAKCSVEIVRINKHRKLY
jgi:nucleotide-binding universal stress UspA family protein